MWTVVVAEEAVGVPECRRPGEGCGPPEGNLARRQRRQCDGQERAEARHTAGCTTNLLIERAECGCDAGRKGRRAVLVGAAVRGVEADDLTVVDTGVAGGRLDDRSSGDDVRL